MRERLLADADGNPLALLELPRGLSRTQPDGRAALPEAITLSPQLEEVFRLRAGRLTATAQTALLIAAADTTGDMSAVLRAMAGLGLPVDALDPAEGAGLVRIAGTTITFRHPLVRSGPVSGGDAEPAPAGARGAGRRPDRRGEHRPPGLASGAGHADRR